MSDAADQITPTPSDAAPAAPLPSPEEVRTRLKTRTAEVAQANENKRNFLGLIRGAKLRVGVVQAEAQGEGLGQEALLAALGLSTASLMLMQIINGTLPVKDAEQAAKVAKMALDIHRQMAMDEASDRAELTPDERQKRRAATEVATRELVKTLTARAEQAESRAQEASPSATPALAIVPATPPVRAEEG